MEFRSDQPSKLTESAQRALDFAREEGPQFQHNYIGTEHLLLGLIRVRSFSAYRNNAKKL